jgi:5-carboxymethyl-2-hydroxymuconate isomerase
MPHLVILYSGNLDAIVDMPRLCREAADAMLAVRDEAGAQVFPTGGTRAGLPGAAFRAGRRRRGRAAAGAGKTGIGGSDPGEYAFMYANLRMARGRGPATQQRAGEAVTAALRGRLDPVMATRHIGLTVQVDEGPEVFDAKHSTCTRCFANPDLSC